VNALNGPVVVPTAEVDTAAMFVLLIVRNMRYENGFCSNGLLLMSCSVELV
jgi:hypothetical protein